MRKSSQLSVDLPSCSRSDSSQEHSSPSFTGVELPEEFGKACSTNVKRVPGEQDLHQQT